MSGNWGGLAGGIAGGLIGGAIGWQAAVAGGALLTTQAASTFLGGFAIGAVEFGAAGFGSGFGAALGSGASFSDAMSAGLMTGAIAGVAGGIIQGSYMAGWQNTVHGASKADILRAKGVERDVGLYRGYSDITRGDELHEGIEIKDNYGEYSGRWEYDMLNKDPGTMRAAAKGLPVSGAWKVRSGAFPRLRLVTSNMASVKAAHSEVTSLVGKVSIYGLFGIPRNCRTEANRVVRHALSVQ